MKMRKRFNITKTDKSVPCCGCLERAVFCHSSCEKYLSWSEKRKSDNEKENLARRGEKEYLDYIVGRIYD